MKKKIIYLLTFFVLLTISSEMSAQSDAFYYEEVNQMERNIDNGVAYDALSENYGFSFNDFNNANSNGFDFGNFQFNGKDVSIGSGILFLGSMALLRLRIKRKSEDNK